MKRRSKIGAFVFIGLVAMVLVAYGGYLYFVNSVEKPDYDAVLTDGAFEVRDYPALVVAEITTSGDRWTAVSEGFRPLAAYIFARERKGGKIAMTAPVTQERETIPMTAPVTQSRDRAGSGSWTIRFIMPTSYTLESLPRPANPNVRLIRIPAARKAVIRFGGIATDDLITRKEAALHEWMKRRNLIPIGPPTYAYYNAPFTPGFLRRNEILFDVVNSGTP